MRQALLTLVLAITCSTPVLADMDMAKNKNCLGCHAMDSALVGPAFKAVAEKYRDDKDAGAQLALKIRKGGSGVWGPMAMPANAQVSEADAKKLAKWVLSLK